MEKPKTMPISEAIAQEQDETYVRALTLLRSAFGEEVVVIRGDHGLEAHESETLTS